MVRVEGLASVCCYGDRIVLLALAKPWQPNESSAYFYAATKLEASPCVGRFW